MASADVAVMPIQPSTLNHRLSTPNKLFEALAAGVPVVVSDFAEMREIVLGNPDGPLGAVCRPTDVSDVARAIREVVQLPADEADATACAVSARSPRALELGDREWPPRRPVRGAGEGIPVVSAPGEPVSVEWAWRDRRLGTDGR